MNEANHDKAEAARLQFSGTEGEGFRLRRSTKLLLQHAAASLRPWRWFGNDRLLLLMYHRVLPPGHPDMPFVQPGMYVTPETLRLHIRWLRGEFDLVGLPEWLELARSGRKSTRRACAITFDDGWLDNYQYAWPVLRAERAPATIFIVSALVGSNQSLWPERLARLVWRRLSELSVGQLKEKPYRWIFELAPDVFRQGKQKTREGIDRLIVAAKRYSDREICIHLDEIENKLNLTVAAESMPRDLANWAELKEMSDSGLISLGSHTRHHTRLLPKLAEDALLDEVRGSAREIELHTGRAPTLFCYPNGDVSSQAERLVSQHYLGAVTTARGWNSSRSNLFQLKRIGMHQDAVADQSAFMAKLSAWY